MASISLHLSRWGAPPASLAPRPVFKEQEHETRIARQSLVHEIGSPLNSDLSSLSACHQIERQTEAYRLAPPERLNQNLCASMAHLKHWRRVLFDRTMTTGNRPYILKPPYGDSPATVWTSVRRVQTHMHAVNNH